MGNRVVLYTLSAPIPAPYLHAETLDDVPEPLRAARATLAYAEIIDTNDTGVPVPWSLYFGAEDFMPTATRWENWEDGSIEIRMLPMPCTSVAAARERIVAARSVFDRLAGDALIGGEYWQDALDLLDRLPFPYIAMNHLEWTSCIADDIDATFAEFADAYAQGAPSDAFLMDQTIFMPGQRPYSHAEWDAYVTRYNPDDARQGNAIAMGYGLAAFDALDVYEGFGASTTHRVVAVTA